MSISRQLEAQRGIYISASTQRKSEPYIPKVASSATGCTPLHSSNSVEGRLRVKRSCYESRNHSWMRVVLGAMCSTGSARWIFRQRKMDRKRPLLCRGKTNRPEHAGQRKRLFGMGRKEPAADGLIPNPIDQNPWAHWRSPMDMMRQG